MVIKMNSKIIKYLFIVFAIILSATLGGCKKVEPITNYGEADHVIYNGLLNENGDYLVFIYGNDCSACAELEDLLCEYATKSLVKKDYLDFYVLNSSNTRVNKGLIATEGDDSYSDFTNTGNYQDIKISTTPALIVVEDGRVSDYISTKVSTTPKTDIKEYIEDLMK